MNAEMIYSFLFSIFVLIGAGVIYSLFPATKKVPPIIRKITMGVIIALIGMTLMGSSYTYAQGVFYDARSVIISISGMFLGLIPTLIGMVGMVIIRFVIGGTGTTAGILSIISSGMVGLIWRKYRLYRKDMEQTFAWWEFYLVGLLTSVVVVLSQFALPSVVFGEVLRDITIPLLVVYPFGQLLISYVMILQRNQFFVRRKVQESEEQYRRLFVESDIIQFIVRPNDATIIDATQKAIDVYGYTREEFRSMHIWDFDTASKERIESNLKRITEENHRLFRVKQKTKNGELKKLEVYVSPIRIAGELLILAVAFDKTEELRQQQLLQDMDDKFRTMLLSIGEGVIVVDNEDTIALINHTAKTLLGIKRDLVNESYDHHLRIYSKDHNKTIKDIMQKVLMTGEPYRSDSSYIVMNKDEQVYIDFTIAPILSGSSETVQGAVIVLRDVTMEHRQNEEIRYISQHDHLTGLYNRYFFETELKRLDTKRQLPLSIIMGDVNGLKLMNDAFSHLKGDELLQKMAKILEMATRHEDVVCRWGGDEYAILLPQTSEEDATIIVDRIKEKLTSVTFESIQASMSLGLATKTSEKQIIYDVIKTAEERMYREKLQQGKSMRNSLIATLEATLYEKSSETKEHADNMIELSRKMAHALDFNQDQINTITLVARLHDIGKITLKDRILIKEGPLTEDEWKEIKRHPEIGSRLVQNIPELTHISEGILCHHERYDGTGYPQGLSGKDIPIFSRIVSIVDAYEVMTNGRVYRPAISKQEALQELKKCAGSQFDPELVDIFLSLQLK